MKPLLSVQKFYLDNNVYFEFHPRVFYVKDLNTNEVLLSGQSKDGLYALTKSSVTSVPQAYWSLCTFTDLWHRRLGHPTSRIFQLLVSKNKIICNNKRLNFQCQSCPFGKSSRLSLGPTGHKTSTLLELIFSDVWGPAPLFSSDGYCYFVIFVDAYTKYVWYYPLIAKSDVYSVFHQFQTLVTSIFIKNKICSNWLRRWIPQTIHLFSDHWYPSSSDLSSHSWKKWHNRASS